MLYVIIRGGGDLASGIAVRLHRIGVRVVITEVQKPLAVRRYVSFAEAVYTHKVVIEDITGILADNIPEIKQYHNSGIIPVVIDENLDKFSEIPVSVIVDARMLKKKAITPDIPGVLKIGLGPGFTPGENCDCVVETKRGPYLGRVYWNNTAEDDSGLPEQVKGFEKERVLRSPRSGIFKSNIRIGDTVTKGEIIACVDGENIIAPFDGIMRGLLHEGLHVEKGLKVGDVDPRNDPLLCSMVSDKSLAIGGAVLEAILSREENRIKLTETENQE